MVPVCLARSVLPAVLAVRVAGLHGLRMDVKISSPESTVRLGCEVR